MTDLQRKIYFDGRNLLVRGMQTLMSINSPFGRGEKKQEFEKMCEKFLTDMKKLAGL